ncbi:MAG: hypothetical protein RLZZ440_1004, partial [Planctomycetota bacterium]
MAPGSLMTPTRGDETMAAPRPGGPPEEMLLGSYELGAAY